MAGAHHTNGRLRRILLRGLLLPAGAAAAIIIGASAASADEAPASSPLEDTAAQVQSSVEGAVDTGSESATATQDIAPAADLSAAVTNPSSETTTSEPTATSGTSSSDTEATTAAVEPGVPDVSGVDGEQASTPDSTSMPATDGSLPSEPVAHVTEPVAQVSAQADSAAQSVTEAAPEMDSPAPQPDNEPALQQVAQTAGVGAVVGQVAEVGQAAEVGQTVDRTESVVEPVTAGLRETSVESTPIFDELAEKALTSVTEDISSVDPLTDGAVASITETTPIFDALASEVSAPLAESTGDLTGALDTTLLAPITQTTTALSGAVDTTLLGPITQTTTALTGELDTTLLGPITQTTTALSGDAGAAPVVDAIASAVRAITEGVTGTSIALQSAVDAGCSTVVDGSQSPCALATASVAPGSQTVAASSLLLQPRQRGSVPVARDAIGSALLTAHSGLWESARWNLSTSSQLSGSGRSFFGEEAPASLPQPLGPISPIAPGGSLGGSWMSGGAQTSSSMFLLLLAVAAAAAVLRNGGLSQLAAGTSAVLSGRAALVQDRPG